MLAVFERPCRMYYGLRCCLVSVHVCNVKHMCNPWSFPNWAPAVSQLLRRKEVLITNSTLSDVWNMEYFVAGDSTILSDYQIK